MTYEEEMTKLRTSINVLLRGQRLEILAVREKFSAQLVELRDRVKRLKSQRPPRPRNIDKYLESADTEHTCKGCGDKMLAVTLDNCEILRHRLFHLGITASTGTVAARQIWNRHRKGFCCFWCEKSKGESHSNYCVSERKNVENESLVSSTQ